MKRLSRNSMKDNAGNWQAGSAQGRGRLAARCPMKADQGSLGPAWSECAGDLCEEDCSTRWCGVHSPNGPRSGAWMDEDMAQAGGTSGAGETKADSTGALKVSYVLEVMDRVAIPIGLPVRPGGNTFFHFQRASQADPFL